MLGHLLVAEQEKETTAKPLVLEGAKYHRQITQQTSSLKRIWEVVTTISFCPISYIICSVTAACCTLVGSSLYLQQAPQIPACSRPHSKRDKPRQQLQIWPGDGPRLDACERHRVNFRRYPSQRLTYRAVCTFCRLSDTLKAHNCHT